MKLKKTLMLACVVVILVSFFLPWVSAESAAIGGVSKLLTGKEQSAISAVSGFQVPVYANGDESRFMISILKIFQPKITHADKKSYLIWIVPLFSLVLYFAGIKFPDNKWVLLAVGLIGTAIFCGAIFKITTTDMDKLVLKITIGIGLWLTLAGYLGIGVVNLMEFLRLSSKSAK